METELIVLLVAAGFLAGFVDAIAGGGGLITIPSLLLAGVDPLATLGTNKLQSLFGSGSATIAYAARGEVDVKALAPLAALSGCGALCGALAAHIVPTSILAGILPFLLIAIALYFALKPGLSDVSTERRLGPAAFALAAVVPIGFYDGLFGPGTGSFFALAFVTLAGAGMLRATAGTKLLNFASNLGAFVVFSLSGAILWKIGLLMGVAQFLGARLGAAVAVRFGARIIRPLVVVMCLALALRLILD